MLVGRLAQGARADEIGEARRAFAGEKMDAGRKGRVGLTTILTTTTTTTATTTTTTTTTTTIIALIIGTHY